MQGGWPAANGATQPWFFHTAGPDRVLQSPPNAKVTGSDDEPQQSNGYRQYLGAAGIGCVIFTRHTQTSLRRTDGYGIVRRTGWYGTA